MKNEPKTYKHEMKRKANYHHRPLHWQQGICGTQKM